MKKLSKILIVDDEENICKLIKDILLDQGYLVEYCLNGASALDFLLHNEIDLLILDLHMPSIDGKKVLQHIINMESKYPVIILTAWSLRENIEENFLKDVYAFIEKPVELDRLVEKVGMALDSGKFQPC